MVPLRDTLAPVAKSLVDLVAGAREGDAGAWCELVGRLKGIVWRATADMGLCFEDREDVFAATFFRLFEHLGTIREPAKLPGWLATTARNEVRQLIHARRRTEPRAELDPAVPPAPAAEERILDHELRAALQAAFLHLSPACQEVLRFSSAVPPMSYDEISDLTGIPRGSLGPMRQRCLDCLRQSPALRPFLQGARP